MIVNNVCDLRAHFTFDELPKQKSVKGCHTSLCRVAWTENENGLYDVALEAEI